MQDQRLPGFWFLTAPGKAKRLDCTVTETCWVNVHFVPQRLCWLMILWVILPKTYGIIIIHVIHDENPCQSAEWINPFCFRTQELQKTIQEPSDSKGPSPVTFLNQVTQPTCYTKPEIIKMSQVAYDIPYMFGRTFIHKTYGDVKSKVPGESGVQKSHKWPKATKEGFRVVDLEYKNFSKNWISFRLLPEMVPWSPRKLFDETLQQTSQQNFTLEHRLSSALVDTPEDHRVLNISDVIQGELQITRLHSDIKTY